MKEGSIALRSRKFTILLTILFYLLPATYAAAWSFAHTLPVHWLTNNKFEIHGDITPFMSILGFLASMIKGAVVMFGIWELKKLLLLYSRSEFFSERTVGCFRRISQCLLWWVAAGILSESLLSLILTMNNPAGQKAVVVSFESADLTALVIGGVLSVISSVQDSGRKLQEEADLTI